MEWRRKKEERRKGLSERKVKAREGNRKGERVGHA
jgi:hypothetical protein